MKLFLFGFLLLTSVGSCVSPQSEEDFNIVHFSHGGHDYIYFKSPSYGSTILHDPDCEFNDFNK